MRGKLSFWRLLTLFYRIRVLQNTNKFLIYDSLNSVSMLKKQSLRFNASITLSKIDNWAFFLVAVGEMLH